MPLPAPVSRLTSYTAFAQGLGDGSLPGSQLDADLDQTNTALDALVTAVRAILRADGVLANGSVPRSALGADVMLGLGASRPWAAGATYALNATVTFGYGLYVCVMGHTASTAFATDLAAGRWSLQADLSQAVVIADGSITTAKLPDGVITEPKLAAGAASTRAIADGAVTRAKASPLLGVMPVGAEIDFAGFVVPAGWLFCAGQAVSRAAYPDLFAAVSLVFQSDAAAGSTNLNVSVSGIGPAGAAVEGPGVPSGAVIVGGSASTIVLSQPLTASTTNGTYRILPHGRGDGSTTFNTPDRRGRTTIGRDNMGGTPAGRINSFDASGLANAGGVDRFTLTNAYLPIALPGGSVTVTYPAHQYGLSGDSNQSFFNGVSSGGTVTVNKGVTVTNTSAPGPQNFGVSQPNAGGGNAFSVVQPTGVANRIIFAGV